MKSWHYQREFGFIEPAKGGQEMYIHQGISLCLWQAYRRYEAVARRGKTSKSPNQGAFLLGLAVISRLCRCLLKQASFD